MVVVRGSGEDRGMGSFRDGGMGIASVLQDEKSSGDWLPNNVTVFDTAELNT